MKLFKIVENDVITQIRPQIAVKYLSAAGIHENKLVFLCNIGGNANDTSASLDKNRDLHHSQD